MCIAALSFVVSTSLPQLWITMMHWVEEGEEWTATGSTSAIAAIHEICKVLKIPKMGTRPGDINTS